MKVLFVVADGGGNIPPQLGVARALRDDGADVRFLGHRGVGRRVQDAGFPFETITFGTDFDPTRRHPIKGVMGGMFGVITDRRIGTEAVEAARRHGSDVVIVDMLMVGAIQEVAAAGIATVVFVHCFYRSVQDVAAGPIGWLLRLRGIPPLGAERNGALQLVAAREDLDPVRGAPPVRHLGVVWQGMPAASTRQPVPRVLISLSTCAYAGQRRMMQKILDSVGSLAVQATLTVGPAIDSSALRIPANVEVHTWLDHDQVLQTASVVVGHGGHSTAMRALSFGVPMVVLPASALVDQKRVGAALQQAGAGILLPKRSNAQRIRAAVSAVLTDPRYGRAAGRLGEEIRRRDGATSAVTAINEFVTNSISR